MAARAFCFGQVGAEWRWQRERGGGGEGERERERGREGEILAVKQCAEGE
jgi:hypothetical protein